MCSSDLFLAILDLFRRGVIDLDQEALFDDITIKRRGVGQTSE